MTLYGALMSLPGAMVIWLPVHFRLSPESGRYRVLEELYRPVENLLRPGGF